MFGRLEYAYMSWLYSVVSSRARQDIAYLTSRLHLQQAINSNPQILITPFQNSFQYLRIQLWEHLS